MIVQGPVSCTLTLWFCARAYSKIILVVAVSPGCIYIFLLRHVPLIAILVQDVQPRGGWGAQLL